MNDNTVERKDELPLGEGRGEGGQSKQVDQKDRKSKVIELNNPQAKLQSPTLTLPQRERGRESFQIKEGGQSKQVDQKDRKSKVAERNNPQAKLQSPTLTLPQRERGRESFQIKGGGQSKQVDQKDRKSKVAERNNPQAKLQSIQTQRVSPIKCP